MCTDRVVIQPANPSTRTTATTTHAISMRLPHRWTSAVLAVPALATVLWLTVDHGTSPPNQPESTKVPRSSGTSDGTVTQSQRKKTTEEQKKTDEEMLIISRALSSGKEEDKSLALETLLPALISRDPTAAARSVETLETWAWREDSLHIVARSWAMTDAERAAQWAASLPNENEKETALSDIAMEIARADPAKALGLIMKHGMDDPANVTFLHLTQLWATKDAAAATDWIEAQLDIGFRDYGYSRIAIVKASEDPAGAARFATERISPGPVQEEAAIAVLHQWLPQDTAAAEIWIGSIPEGEIRRRAQDELASFRSYQAEK